MNTIFESASAMQRFRSRNAFHISSPNIASSYILNCKVRKIINKEFTMEIFLEFLDRYGYKDKARADRGAKISHFFDRLERLNPYQLKLILNEYEKTGIWGVIELLSMPIAKLTKLSNNERKGKVSELHSGQDETDQQEFSGM